jgi:hypothetical protein
LLIMAVRSVTDPPAGQQDPLTNFRRFFGGEANARPAEHLPIAGLDTGCLVIGHPLAHLCGWPRCRAGLPSSPCSSRSGPLLVRTYDGRHPARHRPVNRRPGDTHRRTARPVLTTTGVPGMTQSAPVQRCCRCTRRWSASTRAHQPRGEPGASPTGVPCGVPAVDPGVLAGLLPSSSRPGSTSRQRPGLPRDTMPRPRDRVQQQLDSSSRARWPWCSSPSPWSLFLASRVIRV